MTKSASVILVERVGTDDRVARLTLNRPDKLNAITEAMFYELDTILHDLEADDDVGVIILRGSGRAFSCGYDLSSVGMSRRPYRSADDEGRELFAGRRTRLQQVTDMLMYFWNMSKVTISQIHGFCLAGGVELAMMADLVTAASDAKIGHPGTRGLGCPRNGSLWPLTIGMRKAKELTYTGDTFSGAYAAEVGMVNYAWPAEELSDRTVAFADHIAHTSGDHLAVLKLGLNRFYENMGIYSSVRSCTDLDAAAHFTAGSYEFLERLAVDGLSSAVHWRDSRYSQDEFSRLAKHGEIIES
jgi:enoyl-CoA hydratase